MINIDGQLEVLASFQLVVVVVVVVVVFIQSCGHRPKTK